MKKIIVGLGLLGALALAGPALATEPTPTAAATTLGACNPGWYVNGDETGRKPTTGPGGMKFQGNQLIHHAADVKLSDLVAGSYQASPAPSQPSFFSVEVRNTNGAYGTLRWAKASSKWSITIGAATPTGAETAGTFEGTDPVALLTGKVTKWGAFDPSTAKVVTFGVGYTANPGDGVATVVSAVTFGGKKYDLRCTPKPSASSSSAAPTQVPTSQPPTAAPTSTQGAGASLPVTGAKTPLIVGTGLALALAGGGLLVWLRRRQVRFEA